MAALSAPCATPSARAAMEMRPPSRNLRLPGKPSPSSPSRVSWGAAQSEKMTSEVSLWRKPSCACVAEFKGWVGAEQIGSGRNVAAGATHGGNFVNGVSVLDVPEAGTAIFLRKDDAEQAHFGEFGHDFDGKVGDFVPFHDVRKDFAFGEFANAAAQLILFITIREVHGASWSA